MRTPSPGDASLAILLSEEASRRIDRWRRTHDVHYRVVPPHITVAHPPFVPASEWDRVRPTIAGILREYRPFDITLAELSTFETFDQDHHVLWLRPEDKGKVRRIREALFERIPGYMGELPQSFVPHLTVGFFDSAEKLSEALEHVSKELSPLQFRVEDLAYVVVDESGVARVRDRLPLGRSSMEASGAGQRLRRGRRIALELR